MLKLVTLVPVVLLAIVLAGCTSDHCFKADLGGYTGTQRPWTHLDFLDADGDFRFAVIADRTGGDYRGAWTNTLAKVNLLRPEFAICVGDLIPSGWAERKSVLAQRMELDAQVRTLIPPFFAVPGNHDVYYTSDPEDCAREMWEKFFGPTYYSFIYRDCLFLVLDSMEVPSGQGGLSAVQYEWAERQLAAHSGVRWTFIFMHTPAVWPSMRWERFEDTALRDRRYTVFAGDWHTYMHVKRNGHDYYALSVSGGCSPYHDHNFHGRPVLMGPEYGEMDHVAWVTMSKDGPMVANIMTDGVLRGDYLNQLTTKNNNMPMALDRPVSQELKAHIEKVRKDREIYERGDDLWARKCGFDKKDSTACLQKAVDYGNPRIVIDEQPGPWVTGPIHVHRDIEICIGPGTRFVRKPGTFLSDDDRIFIPDEGVKIVFSGEPIVIEQR